MKRTKLQQSTRASGKPSISASIRGAFALLFLGLAACTAPTEKADPRPAEQALDEASYVYGGLTGSKGHVSRMRAEDGAEVLHGETEIVVEGQGTHRVIEDVTLDREGRLAKAEITVLPADPRGLPSRTSIDEATSSADDAPWIYTPTIAGRATPTPLSAWVARRAPDTSPWLRMITSDKPNGLLLPRDQVVVPTEAGTTVILGEGAADVDREFVVETRDANGKPTLARRQSSALVL